MQYLYSIAEIHNHIYLHYFHNLFQHIGQLTNEFIQKIRKAKINIKNIVIVQIHIFFL